MLLLPEEQSFLIMIIIDKIKYFYLLLQVKNIYCMSKKSCPMLYTVCPGSSDPFYIVSYYDNMCHYLLDPQYNL